MPARQLVLVALLAVLVGPLAAGCRDASAGGGTTAPSASTSGSSGPTAAVAPRFARYAALGDSYTAAPGVPGVQSNDGCLRSSNNYPHLLAAALPVGRLADVSCSGADTSDVRRSQLGSVAPQIDAVTRDTDLVTIGLGGNDLDLFARLISTCLRQNAPTTSGSPCADSLGPTVQPALERIQQNLVGVVRTVRLRAPSAKVVLVGYPQIVPASGTCAQTPFAPGDYAFARRVNHGLAETVRRAAAAAGTSYADLWSASAGHDVCAADPWINGISGPGAAPFHPFAVEQAAVARLVAASLG
ncbi:SGNH/GDSL hydrolase family protein [Nocardioides panacihumi]|uniref:SGNH/GDSL hydrolase family protein n=1 Tax=Nocardioides panacihumi TaxID=400774 RepID=A0ABN2QBB7_9ACTN